MVYDEVNNKLETSPYRTHADSWGSSREGAGRLADFRDDHWVHDVTHPIQAFAEPPGLAAGGRCGGRQRPSSSPKCALLAVEGLAPGVETRPRPPPTARQAWAWLRVLRIHLRLGTFCRLLPGSGTGVRPRGALPSAGLGCGVGTKRTLMAHGPRYSLGTN